MSQQTEHTLSYVARIVTALAQRAPVLLPHTPRHALAQPRLNLALVRAELCPKCPAPQLPTHQLNRVHPTVCAPNGAARPLAPCMRPV